jgi:Sulfotransferase family
MRLDPELALDSTLHGRVVFVLASPRTGAERVVQALGRLPGISARPAPTHLFSQGIDTLVDAWVHGADTTRPQGMTHFIAEQDFMLAVRQLADRLLATSEQNCVVEYSPGHIAVADRVASVYPDAHLLHVVRDPRVLATEPEWDSSAELPDGMTPIPGWRAREAARRWCDEQQAVLDVQHDSVHRVRVEDFLDDPAGIVITLADALGIRADTDAVSAAVAPMGARHPIVAAATGRKSALAEALAGDLLGQLGYARAPALGRARLEIGTEGLVDGTRRLVVGAVRRLRSR